MRARRNLKPSPKNLRGGLHPLMSSTSFPVLSPQILSSHDTWRPVRVGVPNVVTIESMECDDKCGVFNPIT